MRAENELFAEDFETKTVNDVPVLFTPLRIDRRLIPENVFAYDIRESDDGDMLQIEPAVRVNHAGTILSRKEFPMEDWGGAEIEDYNFEGDETTLEEWLEQNQ